MKLSVSEEVVYQPARESNVPVLCFEIVSFAFIELTKTIFVHGKIMHQNKFIFEANHNSFSQISHQFDPRQLTKCVFGSTVQ